MHQRQLSWQPSRVGKWQGEHGLACCRTGAATVSCESRFTPLSAMSRRTQIAQMPGPVPVGTRYRPERAAAPSSPHGFATRWRRPALAPNGWLSRLLGHAHGTPHAPNSLSITLSSRSSHTGPFVHHPQDCKHKACTPSHSQQPHSPTSRAV